MRRLDSGCSKETLRGGGDRQEGRPVQPLFASFFFFLSPSSWVMTSILGSWVQKTLPWRSKGWTSQSESAIPGEMRTVTEHTDHFGVMAAGDSGAVASAIGQAGVRGRYPRSKMEPQTRVAIRSKWPIYGSPHTLDRHREDVTENRLALCNTLSGARGFLTVRD